MYNLLYVGKLVEEAILTVAAFFKTLPSSMTLPLQPVAIIILGHAYTVILSANRPSRLANSTGCFISKFTE